MRFVLYNSGRQSPFTENHGIQSMKTGLAMNYTWSYLSEVDSSQFSFLPGSCWLACLCGRSAPGVCRPGRHHQSHSCSSPERSYRPASPYRTPPADLPGHTHYFHIILNTSGLFTGHIAFSLSPSPHCLWPICRAISNHNIKDSSLHPLWNSLYWSLYAHAYTKWMHT